MLAALLALWCAVFALHAREAWRVGLPQVPVFAAPAGAGDSYPTVGGFRLERASGGTGLEEGDRLLRLGGVDLRGVGYFGFDAIAFEEAGSTLQAALVFARAGEQFEIDLELRPSETPWARFPFSISFFAIAVLVLLRAPPSQATRFFFLGFSLLAIAETPFEGGPRIQTYAAYFLFYLGGPVAIYFLIRWMILFPEEISQRNRLSPAWALLALLFLGVRLNYVFGGPIPSRLVPQAVLISDAVLFTFSVALLTHNYWRADPVGRRRVKWVLYGAYLSFLPVILSLIAPFVDLGLGRYDQLMNLGLVMGALLPAGILIAILRFQLFDIDRVISATVCLSALAAAAIGLLATVMPSVARELSSVLGIGSESSQAVLSALAAGVAVPTYRWLRPQVDRLLFVDRHSLETGVRELLAELSTCDGPLEVTQRLGERLATLLRPESCTVFWRADDSYAPIFVRGQAMPPEFPVGSPLVASVEQIEDVLVAERRRGRRGSDELGPFERAAFEMLGASLVLPLRPGGVLTAFLCLGQKRSGDVYTPTDLALLAAVVEKASGELSRYADAEQIQRERELQGELRKYVPGAVVDQIESGGELEAREREVSVLFVDIRGYTTYSESREAGDIFSVINRYTAVVSSLVREHGGSVVEFNGDGMMAVFGAPAELEGKERAAVDTACAILEEMHSVGSDEAPGAEPLRVGVGVASGPAFVGNIRAADRLIWTAIGNTTNLAARLQALSRELQASVVIDRATWSEASTARRGFEPRPDTRIRGRSRTEDLYVLPLGL